MKTTTAFEELFNEYLSPAEQTANKKLTSISNAIALWRMEHHMTQKEFASYMGVSQVMISKWESGEYNFSVKALSEISTRLGLSLDSLFAGKHFDPAGLTIVFSADALPLPAPDTDISASSTIDAYPSFPNRPSSHSVTSHFSTGGVVA